MILLAHPLAKSAFQEQLHPRGQGGRFTEGSSNSGSNSAPQRRTLETTSSWHKLAGRGPRGFKGDADHELPIGSFTKAELKLHKPPSMKKDQHIELLGHLTQVIHGEREATKLAGTLPKKKGVGARGQILIPPGTERRTVNRAYNHAAMIALHEFGVGKYDFAMDDALKAEMKPMVPFIHYARKRILNTMLQQHRGAWRPYREAFGVPFADNRRDQNQQIRLRKPSIDMHQLVKMAFFEELGDLSKFDDADHPRDENGRWTSAGTGAGTLAGGTAAIIGGRDALHLARGTPGTADLATMMEITPKKYKVILKQMKAAGVPAPSYEELQEAIAQTKKAAFEMTGKVPTAEASIADNWRQGTLAAQATGRGEKPTLRQRVMHGLGQRDMRHEAIAMVDHLSATQAGMKEGGKAKHLWRGMHEAGAAPWMKARPGETMMVDDHASWSRKASIGSQFTKYNFLRPPEDMEATMDAVLNGKPMPPNVPAGADKVRVHLRGADGLKHLADIDRAATMPGSQAEVILGRGTKIRIDKVRDSKAGRVIFATAVGQNPKAAFRRTLLQSMKHPAFHAGRLGVVAAAGLLGAGGALAAGWRPGSR